LQCALLHCDAVATHALPRHHRERLVRPHAPVQPAPRAVLTDPAEVDRGEPQHLVGSIGVTSTCGKVRGDTCIPRRVGDSLAVLLEILKT